ncbi:hypothetical protein [Adhaeribacter aquaticus]|uniref:hypothetical protein n=1 Tax=Adhaeribacter aquaticus TaxID=299567 RepID=UPI000479781B|nr:hypothetical protein [Adhaeribacter aquaticus]
MNKQILTSIDQLARPFPGLQFSNYTTDLILHSNGCFSEIYVCNLYFEGFTITSRENTLRDMLINLKVKLADKFASYHQQAA